MADNRRRGQIERRAGGFRVRVFVGREGGKRRYASKTVHGTRKDAERTLTDMLRDRDQGTLIEPSRSTVSDYLDQWLEAAARPRLRPGTFDDYSDLLARHVRPAVGARPLAKLSPLDLQDLYSKLLASGLSARTVRYVHAVIHSALDQATRWRVLAKNPADDVELPRQERNEMSAMTAEQAGAFLDALAGHRDHAMLALAVTTGLRPNEYVGLKWSDLSGSSIRVQRTVYWMNKSEWVFQDVKRARSRRSVTLPESLVKLLAAWKKDLTKERLIAGKEWSDLGLIFASRTGKPQRANAISQRFKKHLLRAGLPEFRLYDLRHTAATLALANGVNAKIVSEQLGHASVAFTLDVYTHVLPNMQDEAAATMEGILFGRRP